MMAQLRVSPQRKERGLAGRRRQGNTGLRRIDPAPIGWLVLTARTHSRMTPSKGVDSMVLDRGEIAALTREYGGDWGFQHTQRLLNLIAFIGADDGGYDTEAVWLAAHLHDWGGYETWARPGVDHALRSVEVAGDFLARRGCPLERVVLVLEAIGTHHSAGTDRSLEARLLSDADALDLLGTVGVLRTFSMSGRDLRDAFEAAKERREKLPGRLCLERSKDLAAARLREMDAVLEAFERESCGLF